MNLNERLNKVLLKGFARKVSLAQKDKEVAIHNKVTGDDEQLACFSFIIKEKEGIMVAEINAFGMPMFTKRIYKATGGDKFDVYTGVALCLFEYMTSLTYQDLRRLFESFAPATKKTDPVIEFIEQYVEGSGIDRKIIEEELERCPETKDGGKRLNLCIENLS